MNSDKMHLESFWHPLLMGSGRLRQDDQTLYCIIGPNDNRVYHNAQISDYAGLKRRDFHWRPPVRLTVRAWASHDRDSLVGTAGFGFWNQPFMPGQLSVRLPRAIWFFFGSPPSNMALAKGVPGYGWKAATFDAMRTGFFGLLPFAPLGFLLMRSPGLYERLWPIGQRAIGVSERILTASLDQPHEYEIVWREDHARFAIDGEHVHDTHRSPKGPLGFVAWLDNQYAIVTPQGRFRFGCVAVEQEQWLALESIKIEQL